MTGEIFRRRVRIVILAGCLALAVGVGPAEARPVQGPTLVLGSAARLAPDGRSVTLDVLAACPDKWTVVEAAATVSQPQASGSASFALTCTDAFQSFAVVVPSAAGTFQLGDAQVDARVTIRRGRTEQTSASETVSVQPAVIVDLPESALLLGAGDAVSIDVGVACPVGASGQESYVNVSQGQQTSGTGFYIPRCDGTLHVFTVQVPASQGRFQAGGAQALTFAFVEAGGQSFTGVDENTQLQVVGP